MVCPKARLPQSQWSDSEGYGQILSVPKHNVASTEHVCVYACLYEQSGRSPKVVTLFSATNFSSNIIDLLQLHDANQI